MCSQERQMMASSWLIMTAAISFSYASPLDHMHPLRPLRSLFHPAIIVSTLGQALIHIACMTLAVQWATDAMGPEALKEVRIERSVQCACFCSVWLRAARYSVGCTRNPHRDHQLPDCSAHVLAELR
jgi:magnesium-transporting ATPase (P-type)